MKKYLIVREIPGPEKFESALFDAGSFLPEFESRGFFPTGVTAAKHPELQGEPTFEGLFGPIFDGTRDGASVVRYESWNVANLLSYD